jgi:hypothetical protein
MFDLVEKQRKYGHFSFYSKKKSSSSQTINKNIKKRKSLYIINFEKGTFFMFFAQADTSNLKK